MSEHTEQQCVFEWAAYNIGKYPELELLAEIPNGGKRDIVTAVNLKAEGVKAGFPDIILPVPRGDNRYHGLSERRETARVRRTERVYCGEILRNERNSIMNKTKIDWADFSWNPVTGCENDCEYCYARKIANRFEGFEPRCGGEYIPDGKGTSPKSIYNSTHNEPLHIFNEQPFKRTIGGLWQKASFPYDFEPTFHRYRLDEPTHLKTPSTIFVCSMADLFGDWVPDEWIYDVFDACAAAPQHRYLFLTKNPARYWELKNKGLLPAESNYWFGATMTNSESENYTADNLPDYTGTPIPTHRNTFVSVEPIQDDIEDKHPTGGFFTYYSKCVKWAILGAETGNRRDKIVPKREWIEKIVKACQKAKVPVFMKSSLADIWGEPLIQETPFAANKT